MTLAMLALVVGLVGCAQPGTKGAPCPAAEKVVARVNCGSTAEYTCEMGMKWSVDQEYTAAAKWGAIGGKITPRDPQPIPGCKAPGVFLSERYGMSGYRFDLPNGKYTVRLLFAETWKGVTGPGMRVFGVTIQGKPVLTDFDVLKEAGAQFKPVRKEFKGVAVTDGKLMIEFQPKTQSPEINGIIIVAE